jgi:GNAT superfamily N-acetyltransferase
LSPDDRERQLAFINSLSERSRYFRLLAPLKSLPPHLLDQFMDVDHERRVAFVASVLYDDIETLISVARYVATDEADTAEVAITVADAWQRRGVGLSMLEQLVQFARSRGIRRFIGVGLPENNEMIGFARALGFDMHLNLTQCLVRIGLNLADFHPLPEPAGPGSRSRVAPVVNGTASAQPPVDADAGPRTSSAAPPYTYKAF